MAKAIAILAVVSFSVASFSIWVLYEAAFTQEKMRLIELAKTQAILIDAVASFDAKYSQRSNPKGGAAATFSQLEEAHKNYPGFGETGEFTLGRRINDDIIFLLSHRHFDFAEPVPIPWSSTLGEPMRRALRGESGLMVGLDYRGETVLAAHEPLPQLKAGIVAKIDLKEIRAPFIRAGLIAVAGVMLLVFIGALVFRRISVPLVERERALDEIRLMSHAIDQSPNMMFITDKNGIINYVNSSFVELTGYSSEEAVGQNPRILNSGDMPAEFFQSLWDNLLAGREFRGEIKDRCKDGREFWASMVAAPVKNDAGQITHFIAIHEDITEQKRTAERMRDAQIQAEVANRAKSEIMANTSHELRTPLNAIIGFSAAMNERTFGPMGNAKYEEYTQYIHGAGEHLLSIINDILDVAAVESGNLDLDEEPVNLSNIIDSAIRIISPKAQEEHVSVTGIADNTVPSIAADPRRFKQIYINLLSNAVKFTPEGGAVSCGAYINDDGSLVLTVTDTGIGMDSVGIATAMTQFGQVDGSHTRKNEGTGLGLPLVQGLVELHGGTMNLASELGQGTVVTISLPAERMIASS